MTDVFVSYKAEVRARVRPLVEALVADGLSVWWDAHIEGGSDWRQAIQEQLDTARCVIVVWSQRAVAPEGKFVRDEATRAERRGVYLPVRIDAVEPPLGFGETQALSLIGWRGKRDDPAYQALLAAARAVAEGKPRPAVGGIAAPVPHIGRRAALIGGGVVAAGALGAGGWLWLRPGPAATGDSIAVLPFANLSGDPAQAYFSDGIAEELRSALSRIAQLKVAARTSSEKLRDADIKDAAHQLGVANVLTGAVRRSAATIRVSAQLVDGVSGLERWSQSFDRPAGDALKIQSDIAEIVAGSLRIRFGHAERVALAIGGTRVPAAQDALLRARAIVGGNLPNQRRKLALLDAALAADPGFATAHAARAAVLFNISGGTSGIERADALAGLQAAAARAVALAPRLAYAQSTLGIALWQEMNFKGADAAYRRALDLGGGDPNALTNIANFFGQTGRGAEAVTIMDRAVALDPLNPRFTHAKVVALEHARRYPEAIATAERAIKMGGDDDELRYRLGDALLLTGKPREALEQYRRVEDDETRQVSEAIALAHLGDRGAADRALAALSKFSTAELGIDLAQVHAQRGELDLAIAVLERRAADRDGRLVQLPGDPLLDPLRGDPRFKALLVRLNFP